MFTTEMYLSHDWRTTWTEQAHRVYDDKKSDAARDAALAARDAAAAAAAAAAEHSATAARTAALLRRSPLTGYSVNLNHIAKGKRSAPSARPAQTRHR